MKPGLLVLAACASMTVLFAQGNSEEARLRVLNADALRLRGLLHSSAPGGEGAIHSQAAGVLGQRPALLQSLMASQPRTALQLSFPGDVLADLTDDFPELAGSLEAKGSWQGTLYYFIEDGVGRSYHHESRQLKVGNEMIDLYAPGNVAGTKCNDVIAASGTRSGNKIVAESSSLVSSGTSAGCSPTGAQNIAVIPVNLPGFPLPAGITPDFLNGVFLGNAFSGNTSATNWNLSDFWTQVSDGKTWINSSGTGALTIVPVTLASNYSYCSVDGFGNYSDNSTAVRQAAYAAADAAISYNDFSRVVLILPDNGSCAPIAGVGSIGCWSSECPGDGACNISWTWWRADQIWDRAHGVLLSSHEMGHNLGLNHAGSRAFAGLALGPLGAAGTRVEYGDLFGTMGNWNFGYYNSQHSLSLGWLAPANVQPVTANGTYNVQSFDTRPSNGVKALKIQRGTGNTNNFLYVGYYPNDPIYLNQLSSQIHTGAIIHYWDSLTPGGKTDLLDFNPATANDFSDPALASGQTWVDPYSDLTIGIGSIVNGTLAVNVTYNTGPCTVANPAVTMVTTSASTSAGTPVNFTVKVQNQDSAACASRSFNLSSTLPSDAGWLSSFSPPNVSLGAGASVNVTLTKTPPATALGSYAVNAIATGGSNIGASDPNNASLTVTPPPPPAAPNSFSASAQYTGTGKKKVLTANKLVWAEATTSVTQFRIQRCKVSGSGKNTSCVYPTTGDVVLGGSALTYTDAVANLSGSGSYRYHVRAEKNGLNSAWTETSVTD